MKLDVPTNADVVVELDIFSGRPNPTWRITSIQRLQLLALLQAADAAATLPSMPPGLGYRGFVVRIVPGPNAKSIHIGDGAIEVDGMVYRDDNRALEIFLQETMPADIKAQFGSLLPKIER